MEIPKKTYFNHIYLEAFEQYLEDKGIDEELRREIIGFASQNIRKAINKERGAWIGSLMRQGLI